MSSGPTSPMNSNEKRPALFSRKYAERLAGLMGSDVENGGAGSPPAIAR